MSRHPLVRFPASLYVLALFAPPVAAAQQADTTRLEEVVVTATRAEDDRRAVPATVSVVSGAELRARGVRFVLDWLREVPGVTVVPTGSYGGQTSLFLRGGESDYTRILVDGVPVNLPGGAVNLANLTTDNVERIEMVRGPASVLYGSDAVAGVIQVFTRRGGGPARLSAQALAGSFATSDLSAGAAGGTARTSWSAQLSRFGSDGFYDFNNGYRSVTGSGRLAVSAGSRSDVAVTARYGDHRSRFPTDFAGTPSDSNQFTTERALIVGLEGGHRPADRLALRAAVSLYRGDFGYENASDSPGDVVGFGFAGTREGRVRRSQADLRAEWRASPRLRVAAGTEFSRESERQRASTTSDFGQGPFTEESEFEADRTNAAAYLQARGELARGVDLHAGLRHDDNEVFGGFTTWRAGLVVLPDRVWRLHLSAGTAFKQPTFSEQFADTPFEVGFPGLRPERTVSWEAGVESRLVGERLVFSATWFDQRFRDLIQYAFTAPGAPTYANVARASARGVELGADWSPGAGLDFSAAWTGLRTRVDEAGSPGVTFQPGQRLLRRPAHTLTGLARWTAPAGWRTTASLVRTGARDDVDFSSFPAERRRLTGYSLVGFSLEAPLTREGRGLAGGPLSVLIRVENALDEEYETVVGFPGRGRTVLAGLRVGR